MKLLIIRPQPAADRTAQAALGAGFEPLVMPLFELAGCSWSIPESRDFDGVLFTSANALNYGGEKLTKLTALPALAVGKATAKAARKNGFEVLLTGDSDKAALLAHARAHGYRKLLWLAGEHRTADAPDEDIIAQRCIIYESRKLQVPEEFSERLASADAVALHSPRAARHFAKLVDAGAFARGDISLAVLAPAIAEAAGPEWRQTHIAREPTDAHLLLAAQRVAT